MADNGFDYPLGAFRAAASTITGVIFLVISACVVGQSLQAVIFCFLDNLGYGFPSISFSEIMEATVAGLFLLPFLGIFSLYGIPLILLQFGCVIQIFQEEKALRNWFILAYCQALLVYIFIGKNDRFGGMNLASIAITLLVLGGIHGFLAWAMNRRIKSEGRILYEYLPLDEEKGTLVHQEKEG